MGWAVKWSPYTIYIWTAKELDKWADDTGGVAMYDGVIWDIKYKKITPNRYKVWFSKKP